MRALIVLALLLLPTAARAGCPEDLAATSEYAGVLSGARTQTERDLALARAQLTAAQAKVKELQAEVDKGKPAAEPKKEEKK